METNEENKIHEADVAPEVVAVAEDLSKDSTEEVSANPTEPDKEALAKKAKSELRSRLVMTFVLGLLIGVAIKTEALKKITIGYNDYLMQIKPQSYDINAIQTNLQKQAQEAEKAQEQQSDAIGTENALDSGVASDSSGALVPNSDQNNQGAANSQTGN